MQSLHIFKRILTNNPESLNTGFGHLTSFCPPAVILNTAYVILSDVAILNNVKDLAKDLVPLAWFCTLHAYLAMPKQSYIYILTKKSKTVLYIGVTSNLQKRMDQHINGVGSFFTEKYKLKTLVYFEVFDDINLAIQREKYLKGKTRKKKADLISTLNPSWQDLSQTIF